MCGEDVPIRVVSNEVSSRSTSSYSMGREWSMGTLSSSIGESSILEMLSRVVIRCVVASRRSETKDRKVYVAGDYERRAVCVSSPDHAETLLTLAFSHRGGCAR